MIMDLFTKFVHRDINLAVEEFRCNSNSLMIDVRTAEEYASGHIPKSVNIPLDRIGSIDDVSSSQNQKIYLYCQSGFRSKKACKFLKQLGYTNVEDIGSINFYSSNLEK